jgi:hypothetical protein
VRWKGHSIADDDTCRLVHATIFCNIVV